MDAIEDRLEELETRAAFQEDFIQQLNAIVTEQQQQIDTLSRKSELLKERLKAMESSAEGPTGSEHEVPPHY